MEEKNEMYVSRSEAEGLTLMTAAETAVQSKSKTDMTLTTTKNHDIMVSKMMSSEDEVVSANCCSAETSSDCILEGCSHNCLCGTSESCSGSCASGTCSNNCSGNCSCKDCSNDMSTASEISLYEMVDGSICHPCAEQWYKFTPTVTARYTIYTKGSLNTAGRLYDCNGTDIGYNADAQVNPNFRFIRTLAAGQTYFIQVTAENNETGPFTLRVSDKVLVNYVILPVSKTMIRGETVQMPHLMSPENADENMLLWGSSDRTVAEVDRYTGEVTALSLGTAIIYARDWNGDGTTGQCVLTVVDSCDNSNCNHQNCSGNCTCSNDMSTAKEISLYEILDESICCQGVERWYKFVPRETKRYTIYTMGDLDTVGQIYESDGVELYFNNNSVVDHNFRIVVTLAEGNPYYIRVTSSGNETGFFTLRVTDEIFIETIVIPTTKTMMCGQCEQMPYLVSPANADNQDLVWFSTNGAVATITRTTGIVTAKSIGTTTIMVVDTKSHAAVQQCVLTVEEMLIYRTRDRERLGFATDSDITPTIAEDLTYGEKSTDTIISNGSHISLTDLYSTGFSTQYTVDERVTIIKNFFESQINYDETFSNILAEMVDHFVSGEGTDYSNPALTAAVECHPNTQHYIDCVLNLVKTYVSQNSGNIINLRYDENLWIQPETRKLHPMVSSMNSIGLKLPVYTWNNGVPGLTLALDSLYGNKIEIESYEKLDRTYSGSIRFTFYDHFGVDTTDLASDKFLGFAAGLMSGFKQWYILQHWNELESSVQPKPFVTNISFSVPFSGTY